MVSDLISDAQIKMMHPVEYDVIKNKRVIDIPVYFDGLDQKSIDILNTIIFISRDDRADFVIRGTYSRKILMIEPNLTIERKKYAITIDNVLSNRYSGEMQIMLKDLPAQRNINVVGYIKPYATILLDKIHSCDVAFRLV